MPLRNNFRHQDYTADPPSVAPVFLTAAPHPTDRDDWRPRMQAVGESYREAGVKALYLVHGTFAGHDAWDLARLLGHLAPALGRWAKRRQKWLVDAFLGDDGNFTAAFAGELEAALAGAPARTIPVRLFHWASQNYHVGRADAALRLLDELAFANVAEGRILLWGHSHAGNVFALLTNLLGADPPWRQRFFDALRPYYSGRGSGAELLRRVERSFEAGARPLSETALDIVTLGTPVRYGWDAGGYAKLLHFIHHRSLPRCAAHCAAFPFGVEELLIAAGGDYVQQIGIAGTDFAPPLFSWRTWRAEISLHRLLQPGLRRRDLAARLALGMRLSREGQTLLVDYDSPGCGLARRLAGHAVYTRREWMLFHAEEIARRFYRPPAEP